MIAKNTSDFKLVPLPDVQKTLQNRTEHGYDFRCFLVSRVGHRRSQEPTATYNSNYRQSTVSTQQATPENQQQTTTTDRYTRPENQKRHPIVDSQQPRAGRKYRKTSLEATTPSCFICTNLADNDRPRTTDRRRKTDNDIPRTSLYFFH
jgi:hypothetical protein